MSLFSHNKIRLRFAPSPTGFLHLGNLRTALFGYLLSKSLKGKFILRLEDTDQKREVEGSLIKLIDILSWVGIKFDEGPHTTGNYGPYIQSERLDIYNKYINELLNKKLVYRCFCSEERLVEMRAKQEMNKQAPRYDRHCRGRSQEDIEKKLASGRKFVIRQKMPKAGDIIVHDELRGDIKFKASDLDDHVLIKSNGVPTYQFANIVDDHLMKISHVTRGDEWLSSFPKNILLYKAFGWTPPKYIHLPLILNKEGGKLSKRQGDVFVENYREKGYLPEAIVNFCSLLGWHPKNDKEILSLSEIENEFGINGIGVSPAIFDVEKLDYYNGHYLREKSLDELLKLSLPYLIEAGKPVGDENLIKKFISLAQDRIKKLADIVELTEFLFAIPNYDQNLLCWKSLSLTDAKNNLREITFELIKIADADWTKENIEKFIFDWLKSNNKKTGDYLWPLRVSLSGLKNSPGPFEIAWALGKSETLERIEHVIK